MKRYDIFEAKNVRVMCVCCSTERTIHSLLVIVSQK